MTEPRLTQPAGWATHCTIRDDNAPHQIRIGGTNDLWWSCTCQRIPGFGDGTPGYTPLGVIEPGTPAEQILAEHRAHVADATAA